MDDIKILSGRHVETILEMLAKFLSFPKASMFLLGLFLFKRGKNHLWKDLATDQISKDAVKEQLSARKVLYCTQCHLPRKEPDE